MNTWEPKRTWVVVVGLVEWEHADIFSPFPEEHRRDQELVRTLKGRGVPDTQVLYLANEAATTRRVKTAVGEHVAQATSGDMLIFYYCGHGSRHAGGKTYFATYDADGDGNPGWSMTSVRRVVDEHFRGDSALLLADCCYAGVLSEEVGRDKGPIAYAALASSLASELSTGNWTFTEQIVAAFQGQAFADADGSGQITLRELADQILDTMAFAEDQRASHAFDATFDTDLVLAAARRRSAPRVGEKVEALSGGRWYRGQIVAAHADSFRIHYFGYADEDDEWLPADSLRALRRATYAPGSAVSVQWKRDWYPARVIAVEHGLHYIEYEGYGPEWREWVAQKRIRQA